MADTNTDTTGSGMDMATLMQNAAKLFDQANEAERSRKLSASASGPVNIDRLDAIGAAMQGTIAAQKAVIKGTQQLEAINATQTAEVLAAGAAQQQAAGQAAGNVAERQATAALATQEANIALAKDTDLYAIQKQSIDAINLAADRESALITAAASQHQKSSLSGVLFGDTKFSEFLNANFVTTPADLVVQAKGQQAIVAAEAKRLSGIQQAYSGALDVTKSTQANLDAGSRADATILAASKFNEAATTMQKDALIASSGHLQRVVATASHTATMAVSEGKLLTDIENAKRAHARFDLASTDKDPESFAKAVRLGGQFLGSNALANMDANSLKIYMNNPATKVLATRAYFVGMGLAGHAVTDPTGAMPNLTGDAGDSALLLEDARGSLPTGMKRTQKLLQNLAMNTEYATVGGVQGAVLKPEQRAALINQKAGAYYQDNAGDIDGTETYGKPPLKTVVQLASMNTDPDVAAFNNKVLKPFALSADNAPADLIVQASLASDLPMNVQIKGLVAYAESVKALNDATARYAVVGLKPASSIPYTAALSREAKGSKKSVALDNESQVRDYLMREQGVRKLFRGMAGPIGAM